MNSRIVVAALSLSAAGFVGIALQEGYTDVAVVPVKGDVPTLGFGTTEGVKMGDRTTPPKALARALTDLSKYEGALKRCVTVPLHQSEYDAYASLAYNIGPTAFCNSTLVKRLNAGDYSGACAEISRWDKFKGKPLPGLTKRRAQERAMCEGR
ncbi:MAG: lysozyme [Bacteroidota bacterium]